MTKIILKITITIFILEPPLSPAPAGAKRPEPVFAKRQPPMCRCKVSLAF